MLQVYLPYSKAVITQRFGDNANPSYAAGGLKGHTAYDWGVPYGTPIPNCVAGAYVYSLMHKDDPILMDYRAVFTLVTADDGKMYEVSYGHVSKFNCSVGQTLKVGDTLAFVGNTGPCYVGQHLVTEAEKDAGSHAGAHLHGPQVRGPLEKYHYSSGAGVPANMDFLRDGNGLYQTPDGFYLGVPNYNNGYNGCISFAPYSTETLATAPPVASTPTQTVEQSIPQIQTAIDQLSTLTPQIKAEHISIIQQWIDKLKQLVESYAQ